MIEDALCLYCTPILATLTPAVPIYWQLVPNGIEEYVSISSVSDSMVIEEDLASDHKQFNIVTKGVAGVIGAAGRAGQIRELLKTHLQRLKGVFSGVPILGMSYVRSVELPNPATGEAIIVSEYQINYMEEI